MPSLARARLPHVPNFRFACRSDDDLACVVDQRAGAAIHLAEVIEAGGLVDGADLARCGTTGSSDDTEALG
jgi:hypothetical protein